jgi:hypothetical protein
MRTQTRSGAAALLVPLLLAACSHNPVTVSPSYTPPSYHQTQVAGQSGGPVCHVFVGAVKDLRTDPHAMGLIAGRPVQATDSEGWVRSALQSLTRNSRIALADGAAGADLTIDAEILKAYVFTITTQKAANVVIRVRFTRHGAADGEQIYRGALNDIDWVAGDDETQSALDEALSQVVSQLGDDAVRYCGG